MAEYIEREAAIEAVTVWYKKAYRPENMSSYNMGERAAYTTAISEIAEIPAADVRPVVLCKDCANCEKVDEWEMWCHGRGFPMLMVSADGFCNYGRKK